MTQKREVLPTPAQKNIFLIYRTLKYVKKKYAWIYKNMENLVRNNRGKPKMVENTGKYVSLQRKTREGIKRRENFVREKSENQPGDDSGVAHVPAFKELRPSCIK